jgi:phosphopantothenate-cysteine ligase/phosphopantothenoylcysteine decarboxylase/phosphopantothenate--cysteine ligase
MKSQRKKILITAGATKVPIDTVRAITNIFSGHTGASIASYCVSQGHDVTLVTSDTRPIMPTCASLNHVVYQTFDDLMSIMKREIVNGSYDVVIHSAAISDYKVSRVCTISDEGAMVPIDRSTKISSTHKTMYLELTQTPKIVDMIRSDWGFSGILVKFKLQVGIDDTALLAIARKSRHASDADYIVANCLEWYREYAYIVDRDDHAVKIPRTELSMRLERIITTS